MLGSMMQRDARVVHVRRSWSSCVEFDAEVEGAPAGARVFLPGTELRALALTDLVGDVEVGTHVRLDCSALAKNLGTGGFATTLSCSTLPEDRVPEVGHIVKARYMPHQPVVLAVEEQGSPHRAVMEDADSLDGMVVVGADLHSALPIIAHSARTTGEQLRIAYVMDDTAALPAALSRLVVDCRDKGLVDTVITAGQSFGGDLEAASIPSALLAARHVAGADVAIVAPGPGNLGTGTRWGFSGTRLADTFHVTAALSGRPVATVRASAADPRVEHRGISHHTRDVLTVLTHVAVRVAVPALSPVDETSVDVEVRKMMNRHIAELRTRHQVDDVDWTECVDTVRSCPVALRSMGRSPEDDPLAFTCAAAAGVSAARLVVTTE